MDGSACLPIPWDTRMKHQKPAKPKPSKSQQHLRCPTCRRPLAVSDDEKSDGRKSFPFCSERCRFIDLGAWLDAEYRIPGWPDEESEEALTDASEDL